MPIRDILNELQGIQLENTPECEEHVKRIIDSLMPISWLCHPLHAGVIVSRCRRDPHGLTSDQFSYKPSYLNTSFQRASIPYETAFYGSIGDTELEHGDFIAMLETSKMHRNRILSGREYIAVSRWRVIRDIPMALICHPNVFVGADARGTVNKMQRHYNSKLESFPNRAELNDFNELVEFISSEFAKFVPEGCNYNYMISSYFASSILSNNKGIIYPSVQVNGQLGFNIALSSELTDNCLEFVQAESHILFKAKDYMQVPEGKYDNTYLAHSLDIDNIDKLPIIE